MEKIGEIIKLFQLKEAGKGPSTTGSTLTTDEKRKLIEAARAKGIKLPKKGM